MSREWNSYSLRKLRRVAAGHSLKVAAIALNISPAEADLALWTLVGRTPRQAASRLNSRIAA